MPSQKKDKHISLLRVTTQMHEDLHELAAMDERPLHDEIRYFLARQIKQRRKELGKYRGVNSRKSLLNVLGKASSEEMAS